VALSLKRLQPNPWETARNRYKVNDTVPATITTIISFGAFARLEEGLEGLIHISEIPLKNGQTIKDILALGKNMNVRILQVDSDHQRLGLSLKLEDK
jgi:small subunit ribosomal protein S1